MEHKPDSGSEPEPGQTPSPPAEAQRQRHLSSFDALHAPILSRPADTCLSVPEACRVVGVCERTLRLTLRDPTLAARTQTGTRKVGTFYKAIQLLPPDLVDDLCLRFAEKKNGNTGPD